MPPVEVVAHRIVWALVFLAIITALTRGWRGLAPLVRNPRIIGPLALGAVFLAINWGVYVYAVESNQVVEASLGYFINPLVSVALGVIVLREQLRRVQWLALGIAVVAVVVMSIALGHPPWISLVLACSFGIYGLIKKRVNIGSAQSLTIETAALAPIALVVIVMSFASGTSPLQGGEIGTVALFVLLGPITAVPLLLFGSATRRLPLSTVGVLQYSTPILQFILAITVFGEVMALGRWIGFTLVWIALVIFTADTLRHARDHRTSASDSPDALAVTEPD